MAWTGHIITDTDKPDVGMTTAVWNEGEASEFRYSRRAKMTEEEGVAIRQEAIAARDVQIAKQAADTTLSGVFTNILNDGEQ